MQSCRKVWKAANGGALGKTAMGGQSTRFDRYKLHELLIRLPLETIAY